MNKCSNTQSWNNTHVAKKENLHSSIVPSNLCSAVTARFPLFEQNEAFQPSNPSDRREAVVAAASPCCCCVARNLQPGDNGKLMQLAVGNLHPALNLHGWEIITGSSGSQTRATRLSLGPCSSAWPTAATLLVYHRGFLSPVASQWNYFYHFHFSFL